MDRAPTPDRHLARGPMLVRSRALPFVLVGLMGAAVIAGMVVLRRGDLDLDESVGTALVIVLAFWLLTLTIGTAARRLQTGYALKLDARGLHLPGWDVVPWSAIRSARVEHARKLVGLQRHDLMLDIDPACRAVVAGTYVRWMFGPLAGLPIPGVPNQHRPIRILLNTMEIAPDALRAAVESMLRHAPEAADRRPT